MGLSFAIGSEFYINLSETGFFDNIYVELDFIFSNFSPTNVFYGLKNIFNIVINVFETVDSNLIIIGIISLAVFVVLYGILSHMSNLASLDCINSMMSSKTKISFFKSLVAKSFKSIKFLVIKFIIALPFLALAFAVLYFGFNYIDLINIGIVRLFVPFLMLILLSLIFGLYYTLITGFGASIIINDKGVIKGFFLGFKATSKKFLRVFSNAFIIAMLVLIFNLVAALFSFGFGLILSLPITFVFLRLFNVVSFYETMGMRYYVGEEIRSPIKLEEQDRISKLKYIV